jgi:DNA replication and repair protein RecF
MRAETGEYPLFILDDVLSELDKDRQKRLLSKLSGVQTVLTATHLDEEVFQGLSYRLFTVDHGTYTVKEKM